MSLSDASLVTLLQAKNYLRVDAAASLHVSAEFVGVGTGAEDEFNLDETPIDGTLRLYVNNVLQVEGTDFSISTATITFDTAPTLNHGITANYDYTAGDDTFESWDDLELESMIAAATRLAEGYTGRAFIQREIVETRVGDGTAALVMYKRPVVDVASISVDGAALETWIERLSIGRIYNTSYHWTTDAEIVVTYTAGYGETRAATQLLVPDAVTAVLLILSNLYENRTDLVDVESITGVGSVTYGATGQAKRLLDSLVVSVL